MKRILIGLAVGAVSTAVPAAAQGAWSRAKFLSPSFHLAIYPRVAFDGRGNAVAVWMQLRDGGNYQIYSARWLVSRRSWSRAVRVSPAGHDAEAPRLAVNSAGQAVVVWDADVVSFTGQPRSAPSVQAAFLRSIGGRWTPAARISRRETGAGQPVVGIDGRGRAVAVWAQLANGHSRIDTATRRAGSGRWSAPAALDTAPAAHPLILPQVAVSQHGDALATWMRDSSGGVLTGMAARVRAALKRAGHHWRQPSTLGTQVEPPGEDSASFEFTAPRPALDEAGDLAVVWQARHKGKIVPAADVGQIRTGWGRVRSIWNGSGLDPHVAMDRQGRATAVWVGPDGSVMTASTQRRGRWRKPVTLARSDPYRPYVQVATNGAGETVVSWEGTRVFAAVRRREGARWQRAARLGKGGITSPTLDARGDAFVLWQHPADGRHGIRIQAARYTPS